MFWLGWPLSRWSMSRCAHFFLVENAGAMHLHNCITVGSIPERFICFCSSLLVHLVACYAANHKVLCYISTTGCVIGIVFSQCSIFWLCHYEPQPSQNTNVYNMVVQSSQMFANITHSITTVFKEHLFDFVKKFLSVKNVCVWLAGS